jgi:hypothetical protein
MHIITIPQKKISKNQAIELAKSMSDQYGILVLAASSSVGSFVFFAMPPCSHVAASQARTFAEKYISDMENK